MPLPAGGNEPWPPPEPAFNTIGMWSAWYSGNTDERCRIYGAEDGCSFDTTSRARLRHYPSQYRGVVGRLARWFMGAPVPQGERRTKLHIPISLSVRASPRSRGGGLPRSASRTSTRISAQAAGGAGLHRRGSS